MQLAKGGSADCGRGLFNFLEVIGGITFGLRTQPGCHGPLMGTNGGDSPFSKPPYFVRRFREGCLKGTHSTTHAKFLRGRNLGFRRCQGARRQIHLRCSGGGVTVGEKRGIPFRGNLVLGGGRLRGSISYRSEYSGHHIVAFLIAAASLAGTVFSWEEATSRRDSQCLSMDSSSFSVARGRPGV